MGYAIKVKPGQKVNLNDFDPRENGGLDKTKGEQKLAELKVQLDDIQEELYAAGRHSVLIVLQGLDTSGKDGAIRGVFGDVNPQGCRVESFKVPTEEELAHDFLWRIHKVTPRKGMIGVFNRSHYEDVLVVRVHELAPQKVWEGRYDQINAFEQLLTSNNTIVLKFYLHISKDEQRERLLAREQDVEKAWKLAVGDWQEREHWEEYVGAYEDALGRCSAEAAPWYIVPANRKWYRDLAIATEVVETLEPYRKDWRAYLETLGAARKTELEAYRRDHAT